MVRLASCGTMVWAILLLSSTVSSIYGVKSGQSGATLDDVLHYLISRYSWAHPQLFLGIWGRPAYTALSSPFAQFGIVGARFFNVLVCLLCGYVAFRIAQALGVQQPWLASAFTVVQPFFFQLSFSTLTEPLFALVLALAVLLDVRRQFILSALCVSLLPLARVEGFVFLMCWFLILMWRRQNRAAVTLLLFPAIWNFCGFLATSEPLYLWSCNPYYLGGYFGYGSWVHYIVRWPSIVGPVLLPLVSLGLIHGILQSSNLLHAMLFLFFVAQTMLYKFGIGSAGYERFFVGVAPLLGVVANQAVHYLFEILPRKRKEPGQGRVLGSGITFKKMPHLPVLFLFSVQIVCVSYWFFQSESPVGRLHLAVSWFVMMTAVAIFVSQSLPIGKLRTTCVVLLLLVAVSHIFRWVPRPISVGRSIWTDVADWYLNGPERSRVIVSASPNFWMAANSDPYLGRQRIIDCKGTTREPAPPGSLLVWDSETSRGTPCKPSSFGLHFRRRFSAIDESKPLEIVVCEKVD